MKVLGVNLIGMLLSIFGWAYIVTHGNVVSALGVSTLACSSPFSNGCFFGVCRKDKINNPSWPMSMPMSSEGMKNDPILEPNHKIFLSHSGAQKEFVEHLCKALEDRFHYPFFDRRNESLPKGERFSELIVQAAEQCEMLIVVVSDEYFMSKWPMIELSTFVKAHKLQHESRSSTKGPKILPLFYGLSIDDLKDATMQKKWFRKWESFAKGDLRKRIDVNDWKYALDVLRSFNGLPYDKDSKEIVAYEEKIVSYVCKTIPPVMRWDDSHVQGKLNILKVIDEKIERVEISRRYKVKVVGIYGVGGIGKTTICKTLCNERSSDYEGRVCHVEFPIVPSSVSKEFFQKVVQDLIKKSVDVIQQLDDGQCKDILRKSLLKQRTFLAIDNILDNHQSIQLAKTLLEFSYHPDSLVVVTARSQSVLKLLGLNGGACLEMPDLVEADAVRLFLHHAASAQQFFECEEMRDILTCVRRCYFSKGDGQGHHYHPLALEALGLQLGCHGENPSIWVKNLPGVKNFNYLSGGNPVFDIMRSGFDLLSLRDQAFFMDMAFFSFWDPFSANVNFDWVFDMYKQDAEEIMHRVERLKRKGLLVDVDSRSKRISMHDLYREFAHLEAKGSLNELLELEEKKWLYVNNVDLNTELESKPRGRYWHKMIRLTITHLCGASRKHEQTIGGIESLEGMNWGYFSNLEVLQICGLDWRHGDLNLEGLGRLRILELVDVRYTHGFQCIEILKKRTCYKWTAILFTSFAPNSSHNMGVHIVGQLPLSLKRLRIWGHHVVLGLDILARCHHLSNVDLRFVEAHSLDLSKCLSLEKVSLFKIRKLQTLSGLAASQPSRLQSLDVLQCNDLVDIPGINHLIGLKRLNIEHCPKFEVLSMNGFNQLEVLSLSGSYGLTSLAELGDLPALQRLDLRYCKLLLRLPNLSKSTNLQELNLEGCSALELYEKDIQMLSKLPFLQPVPFSGTNERRKFKLDLVRRKVLMRLGSDWGPPLGEGWKEDEWEERDLGSPPIRIGKRGTWELDLVGVGDKEPPRYQIDLMSCPGAL